MIEPNADNRTWLIVGYGNELAGDDAFGPAVAQSLIPEIKKLGIEARVIIRRILGPELVEDMRLSGGIILVDASTALPPGSLQVINLQSMTTPESATFSHHYQPQTLIQLAETLHGIKIPSWLIVAGARNFQLGTSLSEELSLMKAQAITHILHLVTVP